MRSASSSASSSACEMKTIETPRFFRSRTRSKKYFFSSGVSDAVGSSKMMILASCSTARAISTICFLAAPSSADVAVGVDVEIERLQELLRGDVDAAQPVVEASPGRETGSAPPSWSAPGCSPGTPCRCRDGAPRSGVFGATGDAVDRHGARGQRHDARHDLGQRRLAGAVLADQRMDLAAPQVEIDALDGGHAGIELGGPAQRQDRCRVMAAELLRSERRQRQPARHAARSLGDRSPGRRRARPPRRCRG